MCLITEQKVALIAESDIECFKKVIIIKDSITSIFYNFKWSYNKVFKTKLVVKTIRVNLNRSDLKSFFYDTVSQDYYTNLFPSELLQCISEGFHSFLNIRGVGKYEPLGTTIIQAIIPKGSEYFIDKTGLIVSNQLIILNDESINV